MIVKKNIYKYYFLFLLSHILIWLLVPSFSIINLHFFPNLYGFSYFLNKSQTHYYGVKISKGLNTPDIHGTTLLVWALSMILEIIEFENFKWNPLKP